MNEGTFDRSPDTRLLELNERFFFYRDPDFTPARPEVQGTKGRGTGLSTAPCCWKRAVRLKEGNVGIVNQSSTTDPPS